LAGRSGVATAPDGLRVEAYGQTTDITTTKKRDAHELRRIAFIGSV
jgi:hypothetical protein